jgi:hypothetical protein
LTRNERRASDYDDLADMQVGEGLGAGMPQPPVPSVLQGTEQDIRMGSACRKELVNKISYEVGRNKNIGKVERTVGVREHQNK